MAMIMTAQNRLVPKRYGAGYNGPNRIFNAFTICFVGWDYSAGGGETYYFTTQHTVLSEWEEVAESNNASTQYK